jgi:hypothetical protein
LWAGWQYNVSVEVAFIEPSSSNATSGRRLLVATSTTQVSYAVAVALDISVANTPLVARIAGGDRSWPVDLPLAISATDSYDPDSGNGGAASLAFLWSCTTATGAPCTPLAGVGLDRWSVNVTSIVGRRWAAASVEVHFTASSGGLLVSFQDPPSQLNAQDTLRLGAVAVLVQASSNGVSSITPPPAGLRYSWSCNSAAPNTATVNAAIGRDPNATAIVLVGGSLLPGYSYTWTVSVSLGAKAAVLAFATTTVSVNAAPVLGLCNTTSWTTGKITAERLSPIGAVFEYACTAGAQSPVAGAIGPPSYALWYAPAAGSVPAPFPGRVWLPLSAPSLVPSGRATLPPGRYSVRMVMTDAVGAQGSQLLSTELLSEASTAIKDGALQWLKQATQPSESGNVGSFAAGGAGIATLPQLLSEQTCLPALIAMQQGCNVCSGTD